MRFITVTLVALSTLAATVFAQQENPITYPSAGDKVGAGQDVPIKWTPTTDDSTVTLVWREGPSDNLGPPTTICGEYLIPSGDASVSL